MEDQIKLTVVSDGTPQGTWLQEVGTGRKVVGLQQIKLHANFEGRPFILSAECKFCVYGTDGEMGVDSTEPELETLASNDIAKPL